MKDLLNGAGDHLKEASNIYEVIFELSPLGRILIQRIDAETFIILNANEAAARYGKWVGFDHKDIVGKNIFDVFEGIRESGLSDMYHQALDSNELVCLDDLIYGDARVPEGVFKVDLVPLGQEKLLISFENITEKKLAEAKVKKANESLNRLNGELDAFAYVASHDLKSPLRAIDNLASWVIEDLGDDIPEESKRHLSLMKQRIGRLEKLLDDLLHYSRAGRYEYHTEQVDVGVMVREMVDLLRGDSTLSFEIAPDLPVFETVKPPLLQVFQNLINNAIKYHDKSNGHIEVGWQDAGAFYQFWVADDGPGIAPEFHAKAFQMFQKLQSRDDVEGTGMGLAVVKKAVESYEGEMNLISDVGKGARFEFSWPKMIVERDEDEQSNGACVAG